MTTDLKDRNFLPDELRTRPLRYLKLLFRGWWSRSEFVDVRTFCLFVGYPRSGHTLVGAMLNAHKNALIAHELNVTKAVSRGLCRSQVFWLLARQDRKFTGKGCVGSGYEYAIPGQWQGRYETIYVIGDKRGGMVSRACAADPTLLDRLVRTVGVPLRLIHVVRHPLDNIATISRKHDMSLEAAADYYFSMCESVQRLMARSDQEIMTLYHEDFLEDPRPGLTALCNFLGLDIYPGYIEDCSALVWDNPSSSRKSVTWPGPLPDDIIARAADYPFLERYSMTM